ncbi:MAG TPA: Hsp20/alpha crystallin family protein [Verrucomicrobiae bacterium]|nr:Hsp20/alpha crystallin family protein [Verrucomicrobiae bacterium]
MAEWNPIADMEALRREIDRAFAEFGPAGAHSQTAFLPGRGPRRYPLVNLHEDHDRLYIEALAPGVDPGSLNLTVVRNQLTISGEKRRVNGDVRSEAFHRSERASGKFVRAIELPVEVNENGVAAEYKNGVLVVSLPKAEKAKPKEISVKVS